MQDEHFKTLNKIGVCYWEGELTGYLIKLLNHNSQYFDELILVSTPESKINRDSLNKNIELSIFSREGLIKRCLSEKVPEEVLRKLAESTSAMVSDLLCYTSNFFFYNYYNRIMYFDLNTLLWNPFMINELFSINKFPKTNKIRLFYEEGAYLSNGFQKYLSSDFSVVDNECDLREVIVDYLRRRLDDNSYCLLGPTFLSYLKSIELEYPTIEVLPIEPNPLDPLDLCSVVTLRHKPHSIGVTMSNTQCKSVGYSISDIHINDDNTCKIYLSKMS